MPSCMVACIWAEKIGIAVERRRLPETEDEPLALSTPNSTIQVASDEAESFGVAAGMTVQGARGLCGGLLVFPYDRLAYEIAARPIWDLVATESDVVEPESPEVCYAEMPGTPAEVVSRLSRLGEYLAPLVRVPIRAAVARSKFVALRAARFRGPNGTMVIPLGEETRFLAQASLGDVLSRIPKLDLKSRQQLDRLGVRTLGDIWTLTPNRLPKSLQKVGHQLLQLAQGFDGDPVRPLWPPRTLRAFASFTEDSGDGGGFNSGVDDLLVIENRLVKMVESISVKLAARHEYTREITLQVGLLDGTFLRETERLVMPESQVPPLFRAGARRLLGLHIEQPIVSLELIASELGTGSGVQLSLLDAAGEMPHERIKRLEAATCYLRTKYGPRVLITGALLGRARRIDLWTYSLTRYLSEQLPQVAVDGEGAPIRYWRRSAASMRRRIQADQGERRRYEVLRVHNRWRETGMRHGVLTDAEVFRVETDPFGVSDIRRFENDWRLTGTSD